MKSLAIIIGCIVFFTIGCNKDFLDKAPGVDFTEDDIFKNRVGIETFIPTIYAYNVPPMFAHISMMQLASPVPISNQYAAPLYPTYTMCDEADESAQLYQSGSLVNNGNITPQNVFPSIDARYYIRWVGLRHINTMLERINEVPDADEAYKAQITGEMHVLRALTYLDMIKRYGGVPIVDSVFEPGVKFSKPRNSIEDCVNFIVKECDLAIANTALPPSFSGSQTGRAGKLVAYCVKEKALLFAASPMFNTATPYLSMADPADNKLICYGNYDENRWKLAADAAREALDYALANGYGLIDDMAADPDDVPGSNELGPVGNYRYAWEVNNNKEIILAYNGPVTDKNNRPGNQMIPQAFPAGWVNAVSVPLNFYSKYERKVDGSPESWDLAGGDDLLEKIAELDPRFKQTFIYTLSYFTGAYPSAQIYNGGSNYNYCLGGVFLNKYTPSYATEKQFLLNDVVFRVNELYLDYAEALNESAGPTGDAYKAVNTIRARSAMPALPENLSKDQFRERVRNERAVELAYDNQRFFDIRRWLIAEQDGVMQGDFWGIHINKTGPMKFSWTPYVFEKRTFFKKMYLNPFPYNEILKGDLVQNPGY